VNPVTRRLLESIADPDLADFALAWDELEEQIVRIYRAGTCPTDEAKVFAERRQTLVEGYGRWADALEPHWREVRIDATPLRASPFTLVLAVAEAQRIAGHWELMRTLPAAREALNGLLLERAVD
jgi:hypothetical protein